MKSQIKAVAFVFAFGVIGTVVHSTRTVSDVTAQSQVVSHLSFASEPAFAKTRPQCDDELEACWRAGKGRIYCQKQHQRCIGRK